MCREELTKRKSLITERTSVKRTAEVQTDCRADTIGKAVE
jgi:hypothetical protein